MKLSTNQKLLLNMTASFVSYVVTFGISFFLSPYLVQTVGVEAYGFVGLANNFISYATLITIALNALAGRFITIRIHEKDYEGANRYYSSVFLSNCIISIVLLVILTVIWFNLESVISIPDDIIWDVKILFAALFANCLISTIGSVFSVATFATNKLYLGSIRSIESSVIRAIVLVSIFTLLTPRVSYLGITSLLTSVYCLLYNIHYTHKLLPFIKITRKAYDFAIVKELISSGVWNLINRLGMILLEGLDLLIANLFINATAMGILSLAKTIPSIISSIVGTVGASFSPNFTILFAENRMEELVKAVKQSMKIMGVIVNLPVIVLIVCGKDFFSLWQPTQDARQLQILSILTIGCIIFSGGINCLYSIFTVVNKLKVNALAVVGCGLISAGTTFFLLKTTGLGIYAIAGVSTVVSIIRNLFITVPYGAKCLRIRWYTFYSDVFKPVLFVAVSVVFSLPLTKWVCCDWVPLALKAIVVCVISVLIGLYIILNKTERAIIVSKIYGRK